MVVFVAVLAWAALAGIAPAKAEVVVNISISRQSMTVTIDGMERFVWPVSTGAPRLRHADRQLSCPEHAQDALFEPVQ